MRGDFGVSSLDDFQKYIASLTDHHKIELDEIIGHNYGALWLPDPDNKPQTAAYYSEADILLYGGAAGAGKTSLGVGLAITQHEKTVIFRAQSKDLRGVEDYL